MAIRWGGNNVPKNALRHRLRYSPPWKLTRWGLMLNTMFGRPGWPHRGCDEWHNRSWFVLVPLLGELVWFPKKGFDRSGTEHLYGMTGGPLAEYHGRIVDGCDICAEILEEFDA